MHKRIFIFLLVALYVNPIFSMDAPINYELFFDLCKRGNINALQEFMNENPTLNINYLDSHGQTPCLYAASWDKWEVVWELLECGADKMIKDNYGQSLFSIAVYNMFSKSFKRCLADYSIKQINDLCKTMPFRRGIDYKMVIPVNQSYQDIVSRSLDSANNVGQTALHIACIRSYTPAIIALLNQGASLDIKDEWNNTPYSCLNDCFKIKSLFVVREAFNNGSCMPAAFICNVLEENVNPDVAYFIKQLYVKEVWEDQLKTPEARIWKPVCVQACQIAGMQETDEKRCLTRILLLPQEEKTKLNIKLALESK